MRYRELTEAKMFHSASHRGADEILFYQNPMMSEITQLVGRGIVLRGIIDGKNLYVWDAMKGTHHVGAWAIASAGRWEGVVLPPLSGKDDRVAPSYNDSADCFFFFSKDNVDPDIVQHTTCYAISPNVIASTPRDSSDWQAVPAMVRLMRNAQPYALTESFESPFAQWRKWWGNARTGELLNVPVGMEHDEFAQEHIEEFLPSAITDYLYDTAGEWWEDIDAWLEAIYAAGWQAILWDGSNQSLMMRFVEGTDPKLIRKFTTQIAKQVPVESVYVDSTDGEDSYQITGMDLRRFIKSGILPKNIDA